MKTSELAQAILTRINSGTSYICTAMHLVKAQQEKTNLSVTSARRWEHLTEAEQGIMTYIFNTEEARSFIFTSRSVDVVFNCPKPWFSITNKDVRIAVLKRAIKHFEAQND